MRVWVDQSGAVFYPHPNRTNFLNGETLSNGNALPYPAESRNVAMINGSLNCLDQGFNPGDELFSGFIFALLADVNIDLYSIPASGSGEVGFYSYYDMVPLSWLLGSPPVDVLLYYVAGLRPFDYAPGSYLDYSQLSDSWPYWFGVFADGYNYHLNTIEFVTEGSSLDLAADATTFTPNLTSAAGSPFNAFYGNENNNTFHVEEGLGYLSSILQNVVDQEFMLYDLYLQHKTLRSIRYEAKNTVTAGFQVVPASYVTANNTWATGNVTVPSSSVTQIRAQKTIFLENGFQAASGSTLDAYIAPFGECGIPSTRQKKDASPKQAHTTASSPIRFSLHPNPATHFVEFDYSGIEGFESTITVYDLLGRQVALLRLAVGTSQSALDLSRFAQGTYYAVLRSDFEVKTQQLVIVK